MSVERPSSKVELSLSCEELKGKDLTSKSDPVIVIYTKIDNAWKEVGRTEPIKSQFIWLLFKLIRGAFDRQ